MASPTNTARRPRPRPRRQPAPSRSHWSLLHFTCANLCLLFLQRQGGGGGGGTSLAFQQRVGTPGVDIVGLERRRRSAIVARGRDAWSSLSLSNGAVDTHLRLPKGRSAVVVGYRNVDAVDVEEGKPIDSSSPRPSSPSPMHQESSATEVEPTPVNDNDDEDGKDTDESRRSQTKRAWDGEDSDKLKRSRTKRAWDAAKRLVRRRRRRQKRRDEFGEETDDASSPSSLSSAAASTENASTVTVNNVHELRHATLVRKIPLKELRFDSNDDNYDGKGGYSSFSTGNSTDAIPNCTTVTIDQLQNHPVMRLIADRVQTNSTPGNRSPDDTAHLSLAIEGGGMRGAVSAGMAAAIASLGLSDVFDDVYGSSAGATVGAYVVSRQFCVDVYTDVLPAAGPLFASRSRVLGNLGVGLAKDWVGRMTPGAFAVGRNGGGDASSTSLDDVVVNGAGSNGRTTAATADNSTTTTTTSSMTAAVGKAASVATGALHKATQTLPAPLRKVGSRASLVVPRLVSAAKPYFTLHHGMNISFVVDGIMSERHGLRPFDLDSFRTNDAVQPLRIVSSTVRGDDMLETVAFSGAEGDYWDIEVDDEEALPVGRRRRRRRFVVVVVDRMRLMLRSFAVRTVGIGIGRVKRTKNTVLDRTVRRRQRQLRHRNQSQEVERSDDGMAAATRSDEEEPHPEEEEKREGSPPSSVLPGSKALMGKSREDDERVDGKRPIRYRKATSCAESSGKTGFFACLGSSMLVPGAAGPPFKLLRSKHRREAETAGTRSMTNVCFDAFCYEPMPYRSAVANGATHVLTLRSRPDGCSVETQPALYERVVAPLYFRSNGLPAVAKYFEKGGQQYRYLEDVMTLDEGLAAGCAPTDLPSEKVGVTIPPTEILFGTENDEDIVVDTSSWKRAHLLPVTLPAGTPELPSLTQDKDQVLEAVRYGYAAAFDMLAPFSNLGSDGRVIEGRRVAEMVFPKREDDVVYVLQTPVKVKGEVIKKNEQEREATARRRFVSWIAKKRKSRQRSKNKLLKNPERAAAVEAERASEMNQYMEDDNFEWLEAETLLAVLPGFQRGKLTHLSGGLRSNVADA